MDIYEVSRRVLALEMKGYMEVSDAAPHLSNAFNDYYLIWLAARDDYSFNQMVYLANLAGYVS